MARAITFVVAGVVPGLGWSQFHHTTTVLRSGCECRCARRQHLSVGAHRSVQRLGQDLYQAEEGHLRLERLVVGETFVARWYVYFVLNEKKESFLK